MYMVNNWINKTHNLQINKEALMLVLSQLFHKEQQLNVAKNTKYRGCVWSVFINQWNCVYYV